MLARYTDVDLIDEEPAINNYIYSRLVPLEKSVIPLGTLVNGINIHVKTAKETTRTIPLEHGLTHDEAAAIYLYSMQTGSRSLYHVLNNTLRKNTLEKLKSEFLYLKLLRTALNKLPSIQKQVRRGVSKDISLGYTQGVSFT